MSKLAAAGLVAMLAVACGASPTAPPKVPIPDSPGISELRITGLPETLSRGSTAQLTAEAVLQTGAVKECAAAWSVDDERVATVSSSGLLTSGITGFVNVAASCAGITARAETRVEAVRPYSFLISTYDTEFGPPPARSVGGEAEFLDGPRAGQSMLIGDFGSAPSDVPWPVKLRITLDKFEPKEFLLAETTGERLCDTDCEPEDPQFVFWIPMTFAPDALTDVHTRRMSETELEVAHPFAMRMPGPVQVLAWWDLDYPASLAAELWCGGKILRSYGPWIGTTDHGFTHDVEAPGACEVRVRKSDALGKGNFADTHYRVTIRYAR